MQAPGLRCWAHQLLVVLGQWVALLENYRKVEFGLFSLSLSALDHWQLLLPMMSKEDGENKVSLTSLGKDHCDSRHHS